MVADRRDPVAQLVCGQATREPTSYTDEATGIKFDTWAANDNMTIGVSLPSDALDKNADEMIGLLVRYHPTRLLLC